MDHWPQLVTEVGSADLVVDHNPQLWSAGSTGLEEVVDHVSQVLSLLEVGFTGLEVVVGHWFHG